MLAMISWHDDTRFVPAPIRMAFQIAAICGVLLVVPADEVVFANILPLWADRLITAICWLWFINLFNFMDGIDGICGVEILHLSFGMLIIGSLTGFAKADLMSLTVIAGATIGFLWWNWHPAKIFLGDVGSVTLGFMLGWLLIQFAINGQFAAALLLPMYFLVDATFTLFKRIYAVKMFWQPHKDHYYQRAAAVFNSHSRVVIRISIANLVLLLASIISISHPVAAFVMGVLAVLGLMIHLSKIIKED